MKMRAVRGVHEEAGRRGPRRPTIALNAMLLMLGVSAIAAAPPGDPSPVPQSADGECFKIQVYFWIDDEGEEPQNVINQCPPVGGDGYAAAVVAHQPVPVDGVDSGVGVVVLVPDPELPPLPLP